MKTQLRTHTCGDLRKEHVGMNVKLSGWTHAVRVYGKLNFLDVRDRYGVTQVVLDERFAQQAKVIRAESVVQVEGTVRARAQGMERQDMKTGDIEIHADNISVLSPSEVLPLDISGKIQSTEDVRLKYRYLDLRRESMQRNVLLRHKVLHATMNYLDAQGFYYITTPLLVKSTPEGARDYVVPSRVHPGKFYALPQSPQIYKQLLMISGFDRYFQFAICLRDEDLRADRQPEHQQLDIEMSFVSQDDIFTVVEGLMHTIWNDTIGVKLKLPFRRVTYKEAIEKYGSDKPDLRFGMCLHTVTEVFANSAFGIFKNVADAQGVIAALCAPKAELSKKKIKKLEELAKSHHAKGLVALKVTQNGGLEGPVAQFLTDNERQALVEKLGAQEGDMLFIVADTPSVARTALGQVRLALGDELQLTKEGEWEFAWIVDFPFFEYNDEKKAWEPAHHPFCMPREEHMQYLENGEHEKVYAQIYDLTLNGVELCSGSIRVSRPDIQRKVFRAIGLSDEVATEKFGFLLEALKYGAPPMGGVGLGVDRITALLCGLHDIREVIAFPKNKNAECPMDGCPGDISTDQLDELGLKRK